MCSFFEVPRIEELRGLPEVPALGPGHGRCHDDVTCIVSIDWAPKGPAVGALKESDGVDPTVDPACWPAPQALDGVGPVLQGMAYHSLCASA